jgi:hypothetical protein
MSERQWEKRRPIPNGPAPKHSTLPVDYLRLVEQTITQALDAGLAEIKKIHPESTFFADGAIFGDEIILSLTLSHGEQNIAATTVYASCDYQPLQEKPSLEDILSRCVDAAGSVFEFYLDPKSPEKVAQIADHSLGALEDAPFDWTQSEAGAPVIWVKIDKSNPRLDVAAEDWLMKNDPDYVKSKQKDDDASKEFLQERLDAIKKAKSGSGGPGSDSGPIRH